MICYSLLCADGHKFDSWFASAEAYEKLKTSNHLSCIICGNNQVEKAIMAPNVNMTQEKTSKPQEPLKAPASTGICLKRTYMVKRALMRRSHW